MKKIFIFLAIFLVSFTFTGCAKKENLKVSEIELTNETYAFAINKENTKLKEMVDNLIDEMSDNGSLDQIINGYFNGTENFSYSNPVSSDGCFIVATEAGFPPFEFMNGNKFSGIDIKIAHELAKKLNKPLYILNGSFDAVIANVMQNNADIGMAGLTVNEDRLKSVDFSKGYYRSSQVVIVRESNNIFKNCKTSADIENVLKNTSGLTFGAQKGTTGYMYVAGNKSSGFDGFKNINAKGYQTGALAIQDLANGKIDGVIIDERPGNDIVKKLYSGKSILQLFKVKFIDEKGYLQTLEGLGNTLLISILGLLIGFILGVLLATIKILPSNGSGTKILKGIANCYVTFLRGTPLLVQLLLCHFAVFPAMGIKISTVIEAVIIYGLNSSAYLSETIRSGIQSVDKGQLQAGRALGFSFWASMIKIVLPQAIKNIVPSLGNEFVSLIKETSVVNLIAVTDLTRSFTAIAESTYEYFIPYIVLAFVYLIIVLIITALIKFAERRFAVNER